jgi:hypothetical protein
LVKPPTCCGTAGSAKILTSTSTAVSTANKIENSLSSVQPQTGAVPTTKKILTPIVVGVNTKLNIPHFPRFISLNNLPPPMFSRTKFQVFLDNVYLFSEEADVSFHVSRLEASSPCKSFILNNKLAMEWIIH